MARGRVAVFLLLFVASTAATAHGDVVLVTRSAATNGSAILTDIDSIPSLSWDGRFVAFATDDPSQG